MKTAMISKINTSKKNPIWSVITFKPFRNEENIVIIPETKFMLTEYVAELELKEGDEVAL